MLDTHLRSIKDRALYATAAKFEGLSPDTVSLLGLAVGLAAAVLVLLGLYWWGLIAWWLNRVLDGLDGTLARAHGRQSDWGGYLDMVLDLLVYALLLVSFLVGESSLVLLLGAVVLAMFYVNIAQLFMSSALLEKLQRRSRAGRRGSAGHNQHDTGTHRNTSLEMPATLVEGAETVVLYSLLFVFVNQLPVVLGLIIVAMAITIGQRFVWAWQTFGVHPPRLTSQ